MLHKTKSVLIKLLLVLCAMCCACALAFGLVGCSDESESGKSISEVKIEDGCLVIYYTDETYVNLGTVVGTNGTDGADGADGAAGVNGTDGADGVGIESVDIVDGRLIITYTTGDTHDAGAISTSTTSTDAVASITTNEDGDIVVTYINGGSEIVEIDSCECLMDEHTNYETITFTEVSCADEVNGVELFVCQDCGYAHINITEWKHDFSVPKNVAVTCTTDGYDALVCSVCEAVDEDSITNIVEATGHVLTLEGEEGKEKVTITQEDIDTNEFKAKLEQYEPTYYTGVYDEDTKSYTNVCLQGGVGVYVCDKCGDGIYGIEVDALGHIITNWEVTDEPTWVEDDCLDETNYHTGVLAGYCSRCGTQATLTLPELQFDAVEDEEGNVTEYYKLYVDSSKYEHITYTIDGQEAYCTDDEREITITITYYGQTKTFTTDVPEHGHVLSDLMIFDVIYWNATDQVYNSEEVYNLADYEGMSIVVNVDGSITGFGDNTDPVYACHEDGVLGAFICYACGDTIYIKVRVAHTYGEDEVVGSFEGSCTEPAYTTYKCAVCGETITEYGTTTDHVYDFTSATYSKTDKSITIIVECENDCGFYDKVTYTSDEYTYEEITEATCEEAGVWEITFVYPKDNNGTEYNVTVNTVTIAHAYQGWDIDQTKIYTSEEVEDLYEQYKGKNTCCDYVEGYYTCDYCGKFISVWVIDPHNFVEDATEVSVVADDTEIAEGDTTKITENAFKAILGNYTEFDHSDDLADERYTCYRFTGSETDTQLDINTIYVIVTSVPENCVNGTTRYKYCSDCGHWVVVTTEAAGHDYDWEMTTEPTETSVGKLTGICSVCGDKVTVDIPNLTDEIWTVYVDDADCQNEGLKTYVGKIDVSEKSGIAGDYVTVTVKVVIPVTDAHEELTTITFMTTVGDTNYYYVGKICKNGNHMYDVTQVATVTTGSADSNN